MTDIPIDRFKKVEIKEGTFADRNDTKQISPIVNKNDITIEQKMSTRKILKRKK